MKCLRALLPPPRQEALLAAISEKDANIALLELSSSKKKKTQDEVALLKREKDRLVQQLKQQVGLLSQFLNDCFFWKWVSQGSQTRGVGVVFCRSGLAVTLAHFGDTSQKQHLSLQCVSVGDYVSDCVLVSFVFPSKTSFNSVKNQYACCGYDLFCFALDLVTFFQVFSKYHLGVYLINA